MTKLKSGHEVVPLIGKEDEELRRDFKACIDGNVRLQPSGWFFPQGFIKFADKIFEFEYKPADVVVMTYPKSGTTWLQEIVWTMRNNPDLNNPAAAAPVNFRCPFIDFDMFVLNPYTAPENPDKDPIMQVFKSKFPGVDPQEGIFLHLAKNMPEPRTLKTHLPFSLLNKNLLDTAKVIYLARNPKDVCMSFYHHCRLFKAHDYQGPFDKFFDYFLSDRLPFSPFWKHIEEAVKLRSHTNLHFVYYEDLKADPKKEIQILNKFIGTDLNDKQINNVVQYTGFSAMKERDPITSMANDAENNMINVNVLQKEGGFFRKGKAGTWQDKFSKKQEELMNQWIKDNTKDMNIEFKYK